MILTKEQRITVEDGGSVPLTIDGIECVVLRADLFEKVRNILDADQDDPRIAYPAILRAWDRDDNTADYEEYRNPT